MSITAGGPATQSSEKRRNQILENALTVFSRSGFAASRVDDISTAAGISRATFYRYFDGKDDIFDALVDLMSVEVIAAAESLKPVTPDRAGRATLRDWIAALIAITERWGTLVDEVIRPRDKNAVARYRAVAMTARFAEIMGERFVEGGVSGLDPRMAAIAITAMTERLWHQIRTWNVEIDRRTVIDSLATIAMKMLHPQVVVPA
jgi:AcrR family transcriptional regulator